MSGDGWYVGGPSLGTNSPSAESWGNTGILAALDLALALAVAVAVSVCSAAASESDTDADAIAAAAAADDDDDNDADDNGWWGGRTDESGLDLDFASGRRFLVLFASLVQS